MSKKPSISSKVKGKKEINEQALARFQIAEPEQQPSSSHRRLRKMAQVNPSEAILPPDDNDTERLEDEQEKQEFVQFQIKDDDDLKREKEEQEKKKQSKKLKGNQNLQNFFAKRINDKPADKKESKGKSKTVQLSLHQLAMLKKQKQQKRKISDDFIVSDNADESKEEEREALNRRNCAIEQYKQYNGTMQDEKKLVQKALQMSLTAASEKTNHFEYPIKDSQINKRLVLQKKSMPKEENVSAAKQKKQVKKRTKSVVKGKDQKKQGPLAQFVIAFTGEFQDFEKMSVIQVCMQLGAECPKSLTKKCNLLIQGTCVMDQFKRKKAQLVSQTDKSTQAKQKGIDIIPPEELDDFFIKHTGFNLEHHLSLNKVRPNQNANSSKDEGQMVQIKHEHFRQIKQQAKDIYIPSSNSHKVETYRFTNQNTTAINTQQPMDIQKRGKNQYMDIQNQRKHQDNRLWTEKYKPTCLQEVVGQGSQIKGLREWLQAWDDIHMRGNKRELREIKGNVGSINSKAALLSGDPGIGKTTTARLLAAQYNFLVSQFNASDVRNKSGVGLLESGSFSLDQGKNLQRTLIIMDEVDGMSSGDRGGVASIIQMIKNSKVPIICICNDRQSEKIRSLAGHCLDIRFHRPAKQMVARRLRDVLQKEGGSGEDRALEMLVQTFQNDMRQILSYLELIFRTVSKRITVDALRSRGRHAKDSAVMINHFQASKTLLNRSQFDGMSISSRVQCFFVDSDMVPLMVQENLLTSNKRRQFGRSDLRSLVQGVEGMVLGDMLDRTIRKEQEWGLMPSFGFMTSVYATEKISDSIGFPAFPVWLGKFSSQRKNKRLARELKNSFFPVTLCSNWRTVKHQYSALILHQLASMLKQEKVEDAVLLMEDYNITPATLNQHLVSMMYTGGDKNTNPMADISSGIKGRLTRTFNKRHEDAKLRAQAKGPKAKVQHIKYDPLMEVGQESADEAEEPVVEQQSAEVEGKPKKSKGGKKK